MLIVNSNIDFFKTLFVGGLLSMNFISNSKVVVKTYYKGAPWFSER